MSRPPVHTREEATWQFVEAQIEVETDFAPIHVHSALEGARERGIIRPNEALQIVLEAAKLKREFAQAVETMNALEQSTPREIEDLRRRMFELTEGEHGDPPCNSRHDSGLRCNRSLDHEGETHEWRSARMRFLRLEWPR